MTFYLRTAGKTDLPAIKSLLAVTWHDTYDRIYGAGKVDELTARWHSQEALQKRLTLPDSEFIVADDGSALLGVAFAQMTGSDVKLHQLYVLPEHQGKGVGQALLEELMGCFPGAKSVSLEVDEANTGARKFYARNGFVETGRTDDCGGKSDQIPALVLSRRLTLNS